MQGELRMIRHATLQDIPALIDLGQVMHAESRYSVMPYLPSRVERTLHMLMNGAGCVLVAEVDGELVGGFMGACNEHYFSDQKVAGDLAIFVAPEFRGGMLGARLIKSFVEWAQEQGAKIIDTGVTTGVTTPQTEALFAKLGGKLIGSVFTWGQHV